MAKKLALKPKLILSLIPILIIAAVGTYLATSQIKKSTESRSQASESSPSPSHFNKFNFGTNAEIVFQMYRQRYTFEENLADVTQQVKLMKDAGVGWAREHIRWNLVEPTQGNWNWQPADAGVNLLSENSIQILAVLGWPPPWASSAPGDTPEADKKLYPPANIADWNNYVTQIVTRYKDKIHAWEILNEVDQPNGTFKGNESQYLKLLQNAYQTIKAIDPNAQVLLAGVTNTAIFNPTSPNREFITNLINLGAEEYFDIFSFHGFYLHHTASDLANYIQKAKSLTTKPLWNTEIGISSNLDSTDDCSSSSEGETIQAEDLPIFFRTAIQEGVEKVFWWRFQDTPSWKCHYFGLVREADQNYSPKPAYYAYQQLTGATPLPNSSPTPSPPLPSASPAPMRTGDINGDDIVDITDYSLLVSQFLQTGDSLTADLNQDGLVDITDYSILVANFLISH